MNVPRQLKYEVWTGYHKFYCKGKVMAGPQPWKAILTLITFLVAQCFSAGTTLVDLENWGLKICAFIIGVLCTALTLLFGIFTAFSDPGVIPSRGSLLDFEHDPFRRQNTLVRNNSSMMLLKHCATCKIVRPPRSVHCQKCNACVLMLDHHCPWLGTCVGMRNYLWFKIFLNFLLFSLIWSLGLHIYQLVHHC